jgi:hypothetical protein
MSGLEKKKELVEKFLSLRLERLDPYHDHKEGMAHAAIVVMIGMVAAVYGVPFWPPKWIPCWFLVPQKFWALAGVMLVWLVVHLNMRWQLRHRRSAAQLTAAILRLLRRWSQSSPTKEDLQADLRGIEKSGIASMIVDYIIPWKWSRVPIDEGFAEYPLAFIAEVEQLNLKPSFGEWSVTVGSLLLGGLLVLRCLIN